jgi:hypothetical protein
MEWTISFLADQQIVLIQTRGVVDKNTSLEMVKAIPEAMEKHNATRLLIDHSEISSVSGSTIEVYYRPQEVAKVGVPVRIKIAEVVLPSHREHFGFLETVFRNRGFDFLVFSNQEAAIEWLTK